MASRCASSFSKRQDTGIFFVRFPVLIASISFHLPAKDLLTQRWKLVPEERADLLKASARRGCRWRIGNICLSQMSLKIGRYPPHPSNPSLSAPAVKEQVRLVTAK
jgi:hypothetical protein